MKKLSILSLCAVLPLALLAGCSGGAPLALQANWYLDPSVTSGEGTHETLEYAVSFSPKTVDGFSADYSGVYRTELKDDEISLPQGGTQRGYHLDALLETDVTFTLNGLTGETLHDTVRSHVEFFYADTRLQPVRSRKEYTTHVPIESPVSVSTCYIEYHYVYEIEYDGTDSAKETYTDLMPQQNDGGEAVLPDPVERTYSIGGSNTFLDNEEVLFALRGLDMQSAVSFCSINSAMGRVETVSVPTPSAETRKVNFTMNGEEVDATIDVYKLSCAYSGKTPGQTQELCYAARPAEGANTYRCVLVYMKTPILRSLGDLQYELKSAEFANK